MQTSLRLKSSRGVVGLLGVGGGDRGIMGVVARVSAELMAAKSSSVFKMCTDPTA